MSRRSHSRNRGRRDTTVIAKPTIIYSPPRLPAPQLVMRPSSRLRVIEDRRTYHPLTYRPIPRTFQRNPIKIVYSDDRSKKNSQKVQSSRYPSAYLKVNAPDRVLLCVRRKMRKEVLHALKKTGKGVSQRKPRRNQWSDVHC